MRVIRKLSDKQVRSELSLLGYELMGEYTRVVGTLTLKCVNNHEVRTSLQNLRRGSRCKECDPYPTTNSKTHEEVVKEFSDMGLTLLEEIYVNSNTPMRCLCSCGEETYKTFQQVKIGQKCKSCGYKYRKERTFSHKYVVDYFKKEGCTLLDKEYVGAREYMNFTCSCGRDGIVQFYFFRKGRRCRECGLDKIRGENNTSFNPDLTDEERVKNRDYSSIRRWAYKVKEQDKYRCVRCKDDTGGNLVSHHLYSYSKYPELREDLSNGVTLCESCHKEFHGIYGYGNNTPLQFQEFRKIQRSELS